MVYYKLVNITINSPELAEVILSMVVWHHGLPNSIMSDRGSLFTSKFWSSLCYFLGIKQRLLTAFHPQTDGQTECQNSMMKAYLRAFVNFEQNDWARLLPIMEFAYNNAKNASTGHTPFELNCDYHPRMLYKEEVDSCSKLKSEDKLSADPRELMFICRENLHHAQNLQKQAHNKGVKPRSYTFVDKVWLNSKYIKTKQNRKLEAKFFGPFRVLHPVGKQIYKLELPRKWRIHDVFYVSLLEQNNIKKRRVDEKVRRIEFDAGDDSKEYKVEAIGDSAVYVRESKSGHLPGLYYLVLWKRYPKEENNWEPASAVQHLRKLISLFHKDHPDKPTATSPAIDTAPPMARPTVKPTGPPKRKRGRPANSTNKRAKKNWAAFDFYRVFGRIRVSYSTSSAALHVTARDFQPTFIKTSTFWISKSSVWLDFLGSSNLSHKASVFFLEPSLGQEVFHWRPSNQYLVNNHWFSSLVSRY